jgi:ABC-type methionine transport system ATPase subunit
MFGFPTVWDSESSIDHRTEDLIELLGLQAFRDKFVSELSTGSRRIVEIAAMLAHRPSVLILDEPSSGIAQKETEALDPLLRRVQDYMSCTLLIIEHSMPLITGLATRMMALDQGMVVTEGTPAEVTNHPAVIESYLGASDYDHLLVPEQAAEEEEPAPARTRARASAGGRKNGGGRTGGGRSTTVKKPARPRRSPRVEGLP